MTAIGKSATALGRRMTVVRCPGPVKNAACPTAGQQEKHYGKHKDTCHCFLFEFSRCGFLHQCPRLFSFFFTCFISKRRCASASLCSRLIGRRSVFISSRCIWSACWDFVPIPLRSVCFLAFLSRRFGLSAVCLVSDSTAGLKTNSS